MITLCAVLHEFGHSIVAHKLGYSLNKIVLMPYGALISGDVDGINIIDEIKVAIAGPIVNLAIALLTASLWWFFPNTYAYTDTMYYICLSLAVVNFIPAYPLDGGRVLNCLLTKFFGKKKSRLICNIINIVISVGLLIVFIYSCFVKVNFTILFFSVFIILGVFSKGASYNKISYSNTKKLNRGLEIKKVAVLSSCTIKKMISMLDESKFLEFVVYDAKGEHVLANINQEKLYNIFERANIYNKIEEFI